MALQGARLAQVRTLGVVGVQRHALRAGADWREPGWTGPDVAVGDPHAGTWRETSADPNGPGQWLSLRDASGDSLVLRHRGQRPAVGRHVDDAAPLATPVIDYTRDVVSLGPFEEQIHVENRSAARRSRACRRSRANASRLPTVFVGIGPTATATRPGSSTTI